MGTPDPPTVEDAVATLRSAGERVTGPRRELLEVLAAAPGHPSAEDLVELLSAAGSSTHRATVYRTLEFLVRAGVVAHVHLPHGATAYHLVDAHRRRHAHLACRGCDRIFDVPSLLEGVAADVWEAHGFVLEVDHVALTGWCATCAPAVASEP